MKLDPNAFRRRADGSFDASPLGIAVIFMTVDLDEVQAPGMRERIAAFRERVVRRGTALEAAGFPSDVQTAIRTLLPRITSAEQAFDQVLEANEPMRLERTAR